MAMRMETLAKEASELPPHERLALARVLLDLDQSPHDIKTARAWEAEIQARVRAVD